MQHEKERNMDPIDDDELVWGALGIRKALNLQTEAQVHALLKAGHLDGIVKRVGRRLVASRRALRARFASVTETSPTA
jgi:hypothetical protein